MRLDRLIAEIHLLVRGGVHQVAYARALENLTGSDMTKLFPSPRNRGDRAETARGGPIAERANGEVAN
jgi:Mn-containing catalase